MSEPREAAMPPSIEQVRAHEMEEARFIQQAMVAVEPLKAPPVELAVLFRPVLEVGGDFLDYFWLDDGQLGLYMGDVVGKGLPAALYAALAVGTLRGINKTGEPPTNVLSLLNARLRTRVVPGRYCAVQYAVVDPKTQKVLFANAGLPHPLHISADGCKEIGPGGLPSGLFPDACYEPYTAQMAAGDSILFSTDGITEARNPQDEEFGVDRLIEVCAANRCKHADELLAAIAAAVDAFTAGERQHDDMTAALLKFV